MAAYALMLAEAPLRIQVLVSQINSGAWVRNGYGLLQAASVYTTQVSCIGELHIFVKQADVRLPQVEAEGMLNADIAALQIAATLFATSASRVHTDHFLALVLDRFRLSYYFNWATPEVRCVATGPAFNHVIYTCIRVIHRQRNQTNWMQKQSEHWPKIFYVCLSTSSMNAL